MPTKKYKTLECQRKATANYAKTIDRIMVNLPKGTKERIQALTGKSASGYISELVLQDLQKRESL